MQTRFLRPPKRYSTESTLTSKLLLTRYALTDTSGSKTLFHSVSEALLRVKYKWFIFLCRFSHQVHSMIDD